MIEITKNKTDQVQIQYTVVEDDLTYMDTIVMDKAEYEGLAKTDKELSEEVLAELEKEREAVIEKRINDKFTAWKEYVRTPTPAPTKEQEQAELAKLEKEKAALNDRITLLTLKVGKYDTTKKN